MNTIEPSVEIARIVLHGLDVSLDQAERIRALIEAQLQKQVRKESWLEDATLRDPEIPLIPMQLEPLDFSDDAAINAAVERIIQAMRLAVRQDHEESDYV